MGYVENIVKCQMEMNQSNVTTESEAPQHLTLD